MALSDEAKLIITMLADIHEALKIQGSVDPVLVREHVGSDFWVVKDEYPGIFAAEERDKNDIKSVMDVLDMWRGIESGFDQLAPAEQNRVKAADGSNGNEPRFSGFDGHTDEVSIARILIETQGRWAEFRGRELDAHMSNTEVHARMLEVFEERRSSRTFEPLDGDDIIAIMNARIHPSRR